MEQILFTVCIGLAVFAAIIAADIYLRRRRLLGEVSSSENGKPFLQGIIAGLGRFVSVFNKLPLISIVEDRCSRRILSAGFKSKELANGFILIEIITFILGFSLGLVLFDEHRVIKSAVGGASSVFIIELWFTLKIKARRESIGRDLPFALDMMTLCVEAGLDLSQAMTRVCDRLKSGPLFSELSEVTYALRTGSTRSHALSKLMQPGSDSTLSSLASLLVQADRMGSGVGPILRSTSARMRTARFTRAERRGAIAAQKALLPLIICIMPATFIVVFGPIAIRLLTGGPEALL